MYFTDTKGRKIFYAMHGRGEPVVLLHHGFGSLVMWNEIYPRLVQAGFTVILFDRPGYGGSATGNFFAEFTGTEAFRAENVNVLAELTDFLGFDSFHLVGQCEGGVVAIDYAARFPERVKTVVTSSTLCYSRETMEEFNRGKFPASFSGLEPEMRGKLEKWHGADYAEVFYRRILRHGGAYGRGKFDLRPRLEEVLCPALVLYPDRSSLFEVGQGVEFYRRLPAGELAVLPKCGHNTYELKPREYVRQILEFFTRNRAGARPKRRVGG